MPDYQGDVGWHGKRAGELARHGARAKMSPAKDAADRHADQPGVHHRAELHQLPDRRRRPQGPDLREPARGRQGGALGHRRERQPDAAETWDVRQLGRQDGAGCRSWTTRHGGWGNIGVDHIVFSDQPGASRAAGRTKRTSARGPGAARLRSPADVSQPPCRAMRSRRQGLFSRKAQPAPTRPPPSRSARSWSARLARKLALEPGQSATVTFVVDLAFPEPQAERTARADRPPLRHAFRVGAGRGRARGAELRRAAPADAAVARHLVRLDAALLVPGPHVPQHLDPGHLHLLSGSATAGSGAGKASAAARAPAATSGNTPTRWRGCSRTSSATRRERVDFGLALQPRRRHLLPRRVQQHSRRRRPGRHDPARLARAPDVGGRRVPADATGRGIKQAVEWLIAKDGNGDGLIEGNQHNTLDTDWFGPVAWLSGAVPRRAARRRSRWRAKWATTAFAGQCRAIFDTGQQNARRSSCSTASTSSTSPIPKHPDAINSGTGCHIDQVFGQSWAFQVGLGRVSAGEGDAVRAAVAVALQLHAGRRPVSRGQQAGPLVRHARRGRPADVHLPAHGLGLRQGQGQRRRTGRPAISTSA